MKRYFFIALIALGLAGCGQSDEAQRADGGQDNDSAAAVEFATYSAADFYNTTTFLAASPSGLAFSPDGKSVLITSDESGIYNAYAVDRASKARTALTTSTTSATIGLSYFPADGRILYTADNGGDELNHIWVREEDGQARDLTLSEKTKAQFAGWSGDLSAFYVTSNERDAKTFDLYRYNASDYSRELIFENTEALSISAISPDDHWLALVKSRTSADSDVYLVDLKGEGTASLISAHEGNIAYDVYDFTPDGNQLILSTNEKGEWNEAWAYDIATKAKTPYVSADWDVSYVAFSATGKYRITGINNDAQTLVSITDIETNNQITLTSLPAGDVRNVRFNRQDSQVAFLLNSDTSPSDLYVAALADGVAHRLTSALSPAINQQNLVEAEVIRYASFDGTMIPSILYRPKNSSAENKVPALVLVHGGPGGQTRRGYRAMVQHLVNHGYAVLGANNRGSSGYGKTFYHMDDRRHGEGDLQDIVQGRAYLEAQDWVDGDKIGIIGGSYGGYMTVAAMAFEPEVFEVGIDIFGVTNWERTLKSIPPWWESFREALYDEMGDPATDSERHHRISPLFFAHQIKNPLLVIQGANDPRVLQVESDELVAAVKANNVPVEYIVFPDEGHGFRSRDNRITASDSYVTFLNRYLKDKD